MPHCVSITSPNGRTILPAQYEGKPETIMVRMDREMLVAALRALWNDPVSDLDADRAYEELADAHEDLTGEEFV